MLKKLDTLVIRTFIGPFLGTTFITSIILILQFFWKYLDDLAGKGLGVLVIAKLTLYLSATVIPLSLPVSVLFASLFTFGGMGERFELVAIKSAGISFMRFLRPVLFLAIIITVIAFWFANNIMPYSNMRFRDLLTEMISQKPALNLKPGVFFNQIEGYTIYVKNKSIDGKKLNNIIIFENPKAGFNFRNVIIAKEGNLKMGEDSNKKQVLVFELENGSFYQEKGNWKDVKNEFNVTEFNTFRKIIDISSFQFKERNGNDKNFATMNIKELDSSIRVDEIKRPFNFNVNHYDLSAFAPTLKTVTDSINSKQIDSILYNTLQQKSFQEKHQTALTTKIDNMLKHFTRSSEELNMFNKFINKMKIEWHKKFSLSLSCFIFFLIGSALGTIIKKGGVGFPLIIAVGFFVFYFFLSAAFEKSSKVGEIPVYIGMWVSNLILLPISIFLSFKALNDSQLFSLDAYYIFGEKLKNKFLEFKRKKNDNL